MFDEYLKRWRLTPDGDPIVTPSSRLLPVRYDGAPAMLKIAIAVEEQFGALLMEWWGGEGAAPVLAHDGDALLLERATGGDSLIEMAQGGRDDEATRIICDVVAELHAPRNRPPPAGLVPLDRWFRELEPAAERYGGVLTVCANTARRLVSSQQDVVVLHGDVHHGNILDFAGRGWLAIDPKGLIGERGFDYANIFCNPDLCDPSRPVAIAPDRFVRRVDLISRAAKLDRVRLLQWILAWTGLSAAWFLGDGEAAETDLAVAELAAAELARINR